jgi:hypothetical protein
MDSEKLRQDLQELQDELERTQCADEHERQIVAGMRADVQELVACSEAEQLHRSMPPVQRLEHDAKHVEADHPDVTLLVNRLLTTLDVVGL